MEPDRRPDCYWEGQDWIYRASKVWGCERALVAARLGYQPVPPSENQQRVMNEGVLHEPAVLASLERLGWKIREQQAPVEMRVGDRAVIRGHVDAVGTKDGVRRVIEVKALAKSTYEVWVRKTWDAYPTWAGQHGAYMEAIGLPGLMAVKNRDSGRIDVREIDEPPVTRAQLEERIARVERLAETGDLGECRATFPCGFFYLHDERTVWPEKTPDHVIDILAASYDEARARKAQAEAMQRELRQKLLDALGTTEKIQTGRWGVTVSARHHVYFDHKELVENPPPCKECGVVAAFDLSAYERATEIQQVRVTNREGQ